MSACRDRFKAIISGQSRGVFAWAIRSILGITSRGYELAIRARNRLYDLHVLPSRKVDVSVISVGNITAGGTGKTPFVVWLFGQLVWALGLEPRAIAILTRGYKASSDRDEPLLLRRYCEGGLVIVGPDRVRSARAAIERGARVLILDDGFQHRRLARDLDILTIDATAPFGYERVLPAGLLREPVECIKRAKAVVITRVDQVQQQQLELIEDRLRSISPDLVVAYARLAPICIGTRDGRCHRPDVIAGTRIAAFCGLGNPDAFFSTLQGLGAIIVSRQVFGDHHIFIMKDIAYIQRQADTAGAQMIITTMKNWLGLDPAWFNTKISVGYLDVRLELTSGQGGLMQLVQSVITARA